MPNYLDRGREVMRKVMPSSRIKEILERPPARHLLATEEFFSDPQLIICTGMPEGEGFLAGKEKLILKNGWAQFWLGADPFWLTFEPFKIEMSQLLEAIAGNNKKTDVVMYSAGAQLLPSLGGNTDAIRSLILINPSLGRDAFNSQKWITRKLGQGVGGLLRMPTVNDFKTTNLPIIERLIETGVPVKVRAAKGDEYFDSQLTLKTFTEVAGVDSHMFEGGHAITDHSLEMLINR